MKVFDLKRFRCDKKLTQKDVAAIFGCTQNFISNIESGVKAIPSDKVAILQERFGDIADYFTDELPTPTKRERIIANATAGESMSQEGLMNLIRRLLRGVGDECCGVPAEQLEREIAEETGRVQSIGDNSNHNTQTMTDSALTKENELLKERIQEKDKVLEEKNEEIKFLRSLIQRNTD